MAFVSAILRHMGRLVLAVLLGGLAGGALARYSSGFGVDERELNSRLGRSSLEEIRAERSEGQQFLPFYFKYLRQLAQGDFGYSRSFNRPVADLVRDRLPLSVGELVEGLAIAATIAILLASCAQLLSVAALRSMAHFISNLAPCVPVAVLGYACVVLRWNPCWALAVSTFPLMFRYTAKLLEGAAANPFVMSARARGIGRSRIGVVHIFLPCIPGILATFGMSVSVAFGALIPIEFATETPGVGQLAWLAASQRDLPLLCILTMITTVLVMGAHCAGDLLQLAIPTEESAA